MLTKKQFIFFIITALHVTQSLYAGYFHIEDLLEDHNYYRQQAIVWQNFLTKNCIKNVESDISNEHICYSKSIQSTSILEDIFADINHYRNQVHTLHTFVVTSIFQENLEGIRQLLKLGLHIDAQDIYDNTFCIMQRYLAA